MFPAGATVNAKTEIRTRLFWRNQKFYSTNGRAVKEVRKVGRYHGGDLSPERPKELYSVV